jgi:hypothetical protein
MFDALLQVLNIDVIEAGDHIELVILLGLLLPLGQQPVPVPAGQFRVPMGKESAVSLIERLAEATENLADPPKESGIVVANSLAGVDQAVRAEQTFRTGK